MPILDFILHIDTHLGEIIAQYGTLTYLFLFLIIFVETGLVFTPFLPGDSLLFAAAAFAAKGFLNIFWLIFLLILAAVSGDTSNYWIGHFFGRKILAHPKIPINQNHIKKTEEFFDKYGGKTIILARFVPIVRTFAPFVAGIGKMNYPKFISFNVIGGTAWVLIVLGAGWFFGNIPFVRENFSLVILAVILISVVPIFWEIKKANGKKSN